MRKDPCNSPPVPAKTSLPVNYYAVKKVGGGGRQRVIFGFHWHQLRFWHVCRVFFFLHNQDKEGKLLPFSNNGQIVLCRIWSLQLITAITRHRILIHLIEGGEKVTEAHRPSPQGWKRRSTYLQQILDLACQH